MASTQNLPLWCTSGKGAVFSFAKPIQFRLNPPPFAYTAIVCGPAARNTRVVTVCQFCQPPVLGSAIVGPMSWLFWLRTTWPVVPVVAMRYDTVYHPDDAGLTAYAIQSPVSM